MRFSKHLSIFTVLAFAAQSVTASTPVDQMNAQQKVAALNHQGSDDSMDEAYNRAMIALMNAAALNIPGAFSNGYKALDHYTNSENLDDLEAHNNRLEVSMDSLGNPMVGGTKATNAKGTSASTGAVRKTTFSRLDPSFMYKGRTNEVATEFEKRSGMKRDEFLMHLGALTDSNPNVHEPAELLKNLENRFDALLARIPNKEFKDGLVKARDMFPAGPMREKLLAEGIGAYLAAKDAFYNGKPAMVADASGGKAGDGPAAKNDAKKESAAGNDAASNVVAAGGAALDGAREPASVSKALLKKESWGLFIGVDSANSDMLSQYLQSSGMAPDSETLFKSVSKKYRLLTPMLIGKINVTTASSAR